MNGIWRANSFERSLQLLFNTRLFNWITSFLWRFIGFKIQTCEFNKIWIHQRSRFFEYLIELIEIYVIFEVLNSSNCWIRRNTYFHLVPTWPQILSFESSQDLSSPYYVILLSSGQVMRVTKYYLYVTPNSQN